MGETRMELRGQDGGGCPIPRRKPLTAEQNQVKQLGTLSNPLSPLYFRPPRPSVGNRQTKTPQSANVFGSSTADEKALVPNGRRPGTSIRISLQNGRRSALEWDSILATDKGTNFPPHSSAHGSKIVSGGGVPLFLDPI